MCPELRTGASSEMYATLGSVASTSTEFASTSRIRMFRFASTLTSSPPTVLSRLPRRFDDVEVDCTMTFTRVSPLPDRISFCRSGEILLLVALGRVLLAARALVFVVMNSAEHKENSTAMATSRFGSWGRDIQFLQGAKNQLQKMRARP